MIPALDGRGALHGQRYRSIRRAILQRTRVPTARLPSTRELAQELGLSRNTALRACEQLPAEGYREGRPGSGTFVAARIPDESLTVGGDARRRQPLQATRFSGQLSGYARRVGGPPVGGTPTLDPALRIDFRYGVPNTKDFPAQAWWTLIARTLRRALTRAICYRADAVASRSVLPVGLTVGNDIWRGRPAWQRDAS